MTTTHRYSVGDSVRYTLAGLRACKPPDPKAIGKVIVAEDWEIVVRWPFGVGVEDPAHIKFAGNA